MADDLGGLSRFVDLAQPGSDGYPADLPRFGEPVAAAIPDPVMMRGPNGGPVALPCFELGLVMAGAVSAGAYTAGVLDYLIEVLDDWEVAKEADAKAHGADFARWSVPPHAVRIRVVAGASAGSVCSALMAVAGQRQFLPVRATEANVGGPDGPRADNPFYDLWVNRLDIRGMLDTADIGKGTTLSTLPSLLNSAPVSAAAASVLAGHGPAPAGRAFPEVRRYFADPLPVALSVANLNGVPFSYRFEGLEGARFATVRHADAMRFLVHAEKPPAPPERAPGGYRTVTGVPTDDTSLNPAAHQWRALADAALGSGAFPVAFAPVTLAKDPDDYRFDLRLRGDATNPAPDQWAQDARLSAGYSTVSGTLRDAFDTVDGGTMNNQPFQYARGVLAGPLGDLDGSGATARKAMMIIDPFPAEPPSGTDADATRDWSGKLGVAAAAGKLLKAWINQARFDANDLSLAADAELYSRFMLSPMRARRSPKPGVEGDTALGQAAIASGALQGFSGFLDRRFRHHDFLLGRRNAENFLRNYFALPGDNTLFHKGWWDARSEQEKAELQTLTAAPGSAKDVDEERLIIPPLAALKVKRLAIEDPDRTHDDETRRKLFVRRHLTEMSPVWPGAQGGRPFDPATLSGAIRDRVDAVLNVALAGFVGGVGRFLLSPIRRTIRAKVSDKAVATLAAALKAHRLDDPFG
jgi:predicted acylesterase/phospholipase RssA